MSDDAFLIGLAMARDDGRVTANFYHTVTNIAAERDRARTSARQQEADHDDFVNAILDNAPDAWDDDEAGAAIALRYVQHLETEVERLGGCMKPWCAWEDKEPCDHGYLPESAAAEGAAYRARQYPR